MSDKVYLLVQEGGTSSELYVHAWDTLEAAEQDRLRSGRSLPDFGDRGGTGEPD